MKKLIKQPVRVILTNRKNVLKVCATCESAKGSADTSAHHGPLTDV